MDGQTDGRTDGGDCNIPIAFLKKRGDNYRLMQVKRMQNAPREHSAILLTFIKLPFVIKIFVLSIFEWPFYTGFTVFLLSL